MCFAPPRTFRHLNVQKWTQTLSFNTVDFEILCATDECAFSTFSRPKVLRACGAFAIVFRTCFAAQRRTLECVNDQTRPEHEVLLAFSLRNVFRAATVCNCSSLISPDGPAPAALASLLLDLQKPQNMRTTQGMAILLAFRAPCSFFY